MSLRLRMMDRTFSRRSAVVAGLAAVGAVAVGSRAVAFGQDAATPQATPEGDVRQLVRVEYVGGFVMPDFALTSLPIYTLASNGLEIVTGPQIAIFPPPALPNLVAARLSEAGIDAVLDAAEASGLTDNDADYANEQVADAATLVIVIDAGDRTVTTTAYALDALDASAPAELIDARERIDAFLGFITTPPSARPPEQVVSLQAPYDFDRLEIVAIPSDAVGMDLQGQGIPWPLADQPLGSIGIPLEEAAGGEGYAGIFPGARTAVLAGDDLEAVVALARNASTLSPWVSEGQRFQVLFRPLLPGETGGLARAGDLSASDATPAATPMA